jgi:valyl-tRNA synthetase
MLSPFMPFITEEIWQALYDGKPPAKSIALTVYPEATQMKQNPEAVADMETLQQLIVTVRGLRKDLAVPEKEAAPIEVYSSLGADVLALENKAMLARLARVADVGVDDTPLSGTNARSTASFDVAVIYERKIDVAAERERLSKDLAKYEKGLAGAKRQLGNEAFLAKAPQSVVDGLKKQQAETKLLYDKTKDALDALPSA